MREAEPTSHFYRVFGLRLHYLRWGGEDRPPLVLVHGGRDHAHAWDRLAEAFAATHAVFAPDLRGHGDSDWAPASQYAVPDFVGDLAALVNLIRARRDPKQRISFVGHSRGAGIILRYAGTFAEQVERIVSLDGLGRYVRWQVPAPQRFRAWIHQRLEADSWQPRTYPNVEAAADAAMRNNPRLPRDLALELAVQGTRPAPGGGVRWKFDPRAHYHPAYDFGDDELRDFFRAIESPVLFIRGDQSHLGEPALDHWVPVFRDARAVILSGAGHWVHHERPREVLQLVRDFLTGEELRPPD